MRRHLEDGSMRFHSTLVSFLVATALALLPFASGARASDRIDHPVTTQTMEVASETAVGEPTTTAMDPSSMDDCCLPNGIAGDPCKRAACCAVHCIGAVPMLQLGLQVHSDRTAQARIARDQVLTSVVGSPPFRPPRE